MKWSEGLVKDLGEGGSGGEAVVRVQLRSRFPGIGGVIITGQPTITALRLGFSYRKNSSHEAFLLHCLFKKLDDYFCRIGYYSYPHITRPLGSINDNELGYLYEWAPGVATFAWELPGQDTPLSSPPCLSA